MKKQNPRVGRVLSVGVFAIFILMPFYALLTAWFASNYGYFDAIRLWKEALLAVLTILTTLLVIKDKKVWAGLKKDRLFWLGSGFIAWILVMALIGLVTRNVSVEAAVYGFIIDTRFFVFMLIALIVMRAGLISKDWQKYILIPAFIVIAFGLLQTLLPNDFLRHFGYGAETLKAFQAVDNKPNLARLQSTMRGPNPLGAYLVPILVIFVAQAIRGRKKWVYIGCTLATLSVLFGTYSRSAWIGAIIGVWLFFFFIARNHRQKKLLYGVTSGLVIVFSILLVLLRNNDYIQNIAFHTNELSGSATSSNQQRGQALKNGLNDVYHNPLGDGVGSAGPASLRNNSNPIRISENFFLQIAQETGLVGLILFLGVLAVIIKRLWTDNSDILSYAVLSSLIGLIVINLVSHAWADDTLAYVFFGIVGLALGSEISTKSENVRYTKT